MKDELADERDYSREASFLKRYSAPECLGEDARFKVPWVWPGSMERVLVMEHVEGVSIGDAVIGALPQKEWNEVRTLPVSWWPGAYTMLTYAVDCISNYRALLAGTFPVQGHANRPKLYEFHVELKVTTNLFQLLSAGRFS
jgi:hypothetical protein